MTDASGATRILGRLTSVDGVAAVRVEDRFDSPVDDVWAALTDPARLAGWYSQVDGDLRVGGELHLYLEADDWEGRGRIEVCEPRRRLRVTTRESDASWRKGKGAPPFDSTIEATLTGDGDGTVLVVEVDGMPLDLIAFFGAGWQIHVENLGAHLAGRARPDVEKRWDELVPPYQELAARLGT